MPKVLNSSSTPAAAILARAAARGQARDDVPTRVAQLPIDLLRHEFILTHQTPSAQAIDEIFLPLVRPEP